MNSPAIALTIEIQTSLKKLFPDIVPDGDIGKRTRAAIDALDAMADAERATPTPESRAVKATFFAGPQDLAGFRACKAKGGSDVSCFAVGDNGVGKWGHDCTSTIIPMAALPREAWQRAGKKGGSPLSVTHKGKTVHGILGDTMPSLANIHNGAGIDLNPGFAVALGVSVERMNQSELEGVTWEWV